METVESIFDEKDAKQISKENNEPEWLLHFRMKAFDAFKTLPFEKSALFKKYSDVSGIEWEKLQLLDGKASDLPAELIAAADEKSADYLQIGSNVRKVIVKGDVVFTSLRDALNEHADLCKKYFSGAVSEAGESKLVAFGNAFFDSGYFLYVPDGVELREPIRVVNVLSEAHSLSANKNLVILEKHSKATVIEEGYSYIGNGGQSVVDSTSDFHIGEGSELKFAGVQNMDENTVVFSNRKALLEKDAKINFASGMFGGALAISNLDNVMRGDGSTAEDFEITFGSGTQRFNASSNLIHEGRNTKGKVASKGVFTGKSKGLFKGMINIGKDARNSNAYLAGHSVLLGKDASSDAIPGLQIDNNDVKATHSASVAQLSEEHLFYLMSRGLQLEEAKKMIVEGFLEPVIRQIPLKDAALRIKALFELKWSGEGIGKLQQLIETSAQEQHEQLQGRRDIFEGHYKYR